MNYERLCAAVGVMREVCNEINLHCTDNIEYVVLQGVGKDDVYYKDSFFDYRITEFYNHNWLGNADFMHIPDSFQVRYNCNHYPIIIAREKDSKKMIGISTIKYDENTDSKMDPYYPYPKHKYFSITGILTKKDSIYKGVGKTIYEIALRGFHKFHQIYQDTFLTCVIDCRNENSMNALYRATESINDTNLAGSERLNSKMIGFYTVTDEKEKMLEAPTIVVRMEWEHCKDNGRDRLEFSKKRHGDLFKNLLITLKRYIKNHQISNPIINIDEGAGIISYYEVNYSKSLPEVISNGTEEGNNRVPEDISYPQGPFALKLIKKREVV